MVLWGKNTVTSWPEHPRLPGISTSHYYLLIISVASWIYELLISLFSMSQSLRVSCTLGALANCKPELAS